MSSRHRMELIPDSRRRKGLNTLKNLTSGVANTRSGWYSLFTNSSGNYKTGVRAGTLVFNNGEQNTATGVAAFVSNMTGDVNTATDINALRSNTDGIENRATVLGAIEQHHGPQEYCYWRSALLTNTTGNDNAAVGYAALQGNTSVSGNAGSGGKADTIRTHS